MHRQKRRKVRSDEDVWREVFSILKDVAWKDEVDVESRRMENLTHYKEFWSLHHICHDGTLRLAVDCRTWKDWWECLILRVGWRCFVRIQLLWIIFVSCSSERTQIQSHDERRSFVSRMMKHYISNNEVVSYGTFPLGSFWPDSESRFTGRNVCVMQDYYSCRIYSQIIWDAVYIRNSRLEKSYSDIWTELFWKSCRTLMTVCRGTS